MARQHYETLQEVFDDAYRGLAAQGFRRSIHIPQIGVTKPSCAYVSADGCRCAIGHLMTSDEITRFGHVVAPVEELMAYQDFHQKLADAASAEDLDQLQEAHDLSQTSDDMQERLRLYAVAHGLTIPSIGGAA